MERTCNSRIYVAPAENMTIVTFPDHKPYNIKVKYEGTSNFLADYKKYGEGEFTIAMQHLNSTYN